MRVDELYIDRYDKEDLREIVTLQIEEYRHLQTQALRLIRIVIAIIAVITATVSVQLLFAAFSAEPLSFSLALNDTAAESLLLGSEQSNISMTGVEARGFGFGVMNQKLGIRFGILSSILLTESIAYSFGVMMGDPPEPIIGVDNETETPQSPEDRMGNWINQNIQTLNRLRNTVTLSYIRLGLAGVSSAMAIAVIIALRNSFIPYLIIIDIFVIITAPAMGYLLYTQWNNCLNQDNARHELAKIFGVSTIFYLIMIGSFAPRMIGIAWYVVRLLPYLQW